MKALKKAIAKITYIDFIIALPAIIVLLSTAF